MSDEGHVLLRNETEQYILKECFSKQYSTVDGGREARFRLAQSSITELLAHTSDPLKKAELAGTLNSLRAFSVEYAKYAESRAIYAGAKQIYDEYLSSMESSDGSMLVPAESNGEKVRIRATDLADIAYGCEQRIQNAVISRSAAAEQEFGAERISGGVDFYGLSTPECADAVLGCVENIIAGKSPEGAAQKAFSALNRQVAEKRVGQEKPREIPPEKPPEPATPEQTRQPDISEQLSRAMERIAALEEQNKRLSERNRRLEAAERTETKKTAERTVVSETVRERISFRQLLAEEGAHSSLNVADSLSNERTLQNRIL